MLNRILTAGTVAGTTLLSPLTGVASGAPADDDEATPADSRQCVVEAVPQNGVNVVDESTLRCYPTLAEALGSRARGSFVIATHYDGGGGGGTAINVTGSACGATWTPSTWWHNNMTSTRVASACTGAKHYTGSNCGGLFEIVNNPYPGIGTLSLPVNNNVGCVKYV